MYCKYHCLLYAGNGYSCMYSQSRVCARNLEIAQCSCAVSRLRNAVAQSRDCAALLRNLEIGTQFEDSENALRNLEIAHIPKLHGTYIYIKLYDHPLPEH